MSGVIGLRGEPAKSVAWSMSRARKQAVQPEPNVEPRHEPAERLDPGAPAGPSVLAALRHALAAAHTSLLDSQTRLQRRTLVARHNMSDGESAAGVDDESSFKPLARTDVTHFGVADLARLAQGDIAAVFGPTYDQDDCNPDLRLASGTKLVLTEVKELRRRGGPRAQGLLLATRVPGRDPVEVAVQAAQVFALYLGLHLCLADATFVRINADQTRIERSSRADDDEVAVEVEFIDLVPRPWLRVSARIGNAHVTNVVVALHEKPGVPIGPGHGGTPARWLGRKNAVGRRAVLSEFHIAHWSRGDQAVAFGPEFAQYNGRKTSRAPAGGLCLIDRVMSIDGERGRLDSGAFLTEYDSPADAWYYTDTANDSLPHCLYIEISGQPALMMGYHFGATLPHPDDSLNIRQLGGRATVLREVDPRDSTIEVRSELRSTEMVRGSILQTFSYAMYVDREVFYAGDTMFGYFTDQMMANQIGLDGGRLVPTWLAAERAQRASRTIDVARRRGQVGSRLCSRGNLALLDRLTVVDGGGRYGKGYLHVRRPIDPDDWLFKRHFPMDPVMPGSFGVEAVVQAMQEWLLDSGMAKGIRDPGFVLPVGVPFSWKYRGQFIRTDRESMLEVHIKDVKASSERLRVIADASMWKDELRIYEFSDIAIELRQRGAPPW